MLWVDRLDEQGWKRDGNRRDFLRPVWSQPYRRSRKGAPLLLGGWNTDVATTGSHYPRNTEPRPFWNRDFVGLPWQIRCGRCARRHRGWKELGQSEHVRLAKCGPLGLWRRRCLWGVVPVGTFRPTDYRRIRASLWKVVAAQLGGDPPRFGRIKWRRTQPQPPRATGKSLQRRHRKLAAVSTATATRSGTLAATLAATRAAFCPNIRVRLYSRHAQCIRFLGTYACRSRCRLTFLRGCSHRRPPIVGSREC